MRVVLLPSVRHGASAFGPRVDFIETARILGGEILYPPGGRGAWARLEAATSLDFRQAFAAWRMPRETLFLSLSEKVALPLALLDRHRRPHLLIAHHLSSPRKRTLQRQTGVLSRFSRIVVLSGEQHRYLENEARVPPERIVRWHHHADTLFWRPAEPETVTEAVPVAARPEEGRPYLVAVGKERRDYATLMTALEKMPEYRCILVAGSAWTGDRTGPLRVPPNVERRGAIDWGTLRELYRGATAAVVPLEAGTRYAAGSTALLEAMAVGRPTIVTETPGIADYTIAAQTVPAGDADALASVLRTLLTDPEATARLERAGRAWVTEHASLDRYVASLTELVTSEVRRSMF
ncbi:MAG: glycosyltransferase family 4 protein [Capsulimonadales bacterium]|nr:glycosyltransferase family 4 protein [Capsulimonadales bacterium]